MLTRRDALALPLATLAAGAPAAPPAPDPGSDDPTRVFTGGQPPPDARLGPPKTRTGHFPFAVPATREAWEARRRKLREQVLVATGLWPQPEKTPLAPVVHGAIERDGYTIEKVFFASTPGHYVSGNLYRPRPAGGRRPGVLFAHGHWNGGRFEDAGPAAAAASVAGRGEADLDRARYFIQAVPATLARLGFVVFQYDMVGYADSTAVRHTHGFVDAAAELRLQSFMGLQTWNSVRALDFLCGLPDVDPARVGMTGASGGATQTFVLGAIDDRLAAAFPAVMVGTGAQGGCVCENASHLRVGTGNVELAALFAPKPLAFSAANDWTRDFLAEGYPELWQLYRLYGAGDRVAARAWLEFGHQYNQPAREFMYAWFRRHLQGIHGPVAEPPFRPVVPPTGLGVYDAAHPRPKDELGAPELRAAMAKASDARMAALAPTDAASLGEFRRVVGTALRVMVHDELPADVAVRQESAAADVAGLTLRRVVLGRVGGKDAVPAAALVARGGRVEGGRLVVWVHPGGKSSLLEQGRAAPAVAALVGAGFAVLAPDVFGVGELRLVRPFPVESEYPGFTYGYNRSVFANRVHDLLTAVAYGRALKATSIDLVGWGELGPVAVAAKALAGDAVPRLAADLNRFRFEAITNSADPMMLPGAVKYGGLPAFLALCAPGAVLAHNHGTLDGRLPEAAYAAAGAAGRLTRAEDRLADRAVVEWLVGRGAEPNGPARGGCSRGGV